MQRLTLVLTIVSAIMCAGFIAWRAEAMVVAGAAQQVTAAKAASPVTPAACRGTGDHCPPGYIWNGNRCVPC